MKAIHKGAEPEELARARRDQFTFETLPSAAKTQLQEVLITEQHFLCCYCMRRLQRNAFKVEHWQPQRLYPTQTLNYRNLLAACRGNEGSPPHVQTCELPLFELAAIEAIYQASTGLPRKANMFAHHALFAAAATSLGFRAPGGARPNAV